MNEIGTTEKAVLRTLLYFDLFNHPLNEVELYSLNGSDSDRKEFDASVKNLIARKLLGTDQGYYYITNGASSIVSRVRTLKRSLRYHRISRFIATIINLHPFVRAILVSGSLSKNALKRKDDIDFFIITETDRLWISRTLLMLFKKIFLLNSKKFFCLNYFIDVNSLEIPEKNLFTATEIAFLVPLFNTDLCRSFFLSNDWIRVHYPKFKTNLNGCKKASKPLVKYIAELLLKGRIGDRLDNYFMSLYYKRSRKKFSNAGEEFFNINFKSDKNVAKYHPNGYQQIIMKRYEAKVAEYSFLHQLDLE